MADIVIEFRKVYKADISVVVPVLQIKIMQVALKYPARKGEALSFLAGAVVMDQQRPQDVFELAVAEGVTDHPVPAPCMCRIFPRSFNVNSVPFDVLYSLDTISRFSLTISERKSISKRCGSSFHAEPFRDARKESYNRLRSDSPTGKSAPPSCKGLSPGYRLDVSRRIGQTGARGSAFPRCLLAFRQG